MGFHLFDRKKQQMEINEVAENLQNPDTTTQVPITELFNSDFMIEYTEYATFEELLTAGGFIVNSTEDFLAIPDEDFNKHIRSCTKFTSWNDMMTKASEIYVLKQLGF